MPPCQEVQTTEIVREPGHGKPVQGWAAQLWFLDAMTDAAFHTSVVVWATSSPIMSELCFLKVKIVAVRIEVINVSYCNFSLSILHHLCQIIQSASFVRDPNFAGACRPQCSSSPRLPIPHNSQAFNCPKHPVAETKCMSLTWPDCNTEFGLRSPVAPDSCWYSRQKHIHAKTSN